MNSCSLRIMTCAAVVCTSAGPGWAQGRRGPLPHPAGPAPVGVYTTVTGSVSQLNYDQEAEINGFLLNNNTFVHLPPRAAMRAAGAIRPGDTVQVAGLVRTSPGGSQQIEAQSIQDRSSGKSFTMPQPSAAAPYSGSGRIQQLNYGSDGAVNGFLLNDGTLANVPPFSAGNPSSIRVGASISYSGYARKTMSDRTVVDAQSLTINGQQLMLAPGGSRGARAGMPPPPPAGPAAPTGAAAAPPPPVAPSATPASPPAGRTAEPALPPPPPAQPPQ